VHGPLTLETGTDIIEYICNENNQDVIHITGKDSELRVPFCKGHARLTLVA
jgi:hypothetical protein